MRPVRPTPHAAPVPRRARTSSSCRRRTVWAILLINSETTSSSPKRHKSTCPGRNLDENKRRHHVCDQCANQQTLAVAQPCGAHNHNEIEEPKTIATLRPKSSSVRPQRVPEQERGGVKQYRVRDSFQFWKSFAGTAVGKMGHIAGETFPLQYESKTIVQGNFVFFAGGSQ